MFPFWLLVEKVHANCKTFHDQNTCFTPLSKQSRYRKMKMEKIRLQKNLRFTNYYADLYIKDNFLLYKRIFSVKCLYTVT